MHVGVFGVDSSGQGFIRHGAGGSGTGAVCMHDDVEQPLFQCASDMSFVCVRCSRRDAVAVWTIPEFIMR